MQTHIIITTCAQCALLIRCFSINCHSIHLFIKPYVLVSIYHNGECNQYLENIISLLLPWETLSVLKYHLMGLQIPLNYAHHAVKLSYCAVRVKKGSKLLQVSPHFLRRKGSVQQLIEFPTRGIYQPCMHLQYSLPIKLPMRLKVL